MNLRDACIHGRYEAHEVHIADRDDDGDCDDSHWLPCPGGVDVTIDHEAAAAKYLDAVNAMEPDDASPWSRPWEYTTEAIRDHCRDMVLGFLDAALGVTDE